MTKLRDLKGGDVVILDAGFTCMPAGEHTVKQDMDFRLYVECSDGKHFLSSQEDRVGADLVGVTKEKQ